MPELRTQCDLPDCRPGDILIEHPFKIPTGQRYCYMRLGSYTPYELRKYKLHSICRIAELLGAKYCHVVNATGTKMTRDLDMIAKGQFGYQNNGISIEREEVENANHINSFESESESPGIENLTIEDYFMACEFAYETNLDGDTEVRRLLEARNPNRKNLLKRITIKINSQSEVNQLIDIAATCWAMDIFNGKCNYKETLESRIDYFLALEFRFP